MVKTESGTKLRRVLKAQGRSQAWLGRKTGVDDEKGVKESTLRAYIDGRLRPPPEFRRRCADVLGVPEDMLFEEAGDDPRMEE